jgi:hypothetical protein
MAKVKIQGHASGTGILTVTAPNTSTDRTITLPDATGTLLNSDGDGSSLTGVGVDGIVSTANATAMTINSSEQVGIGTASPTSMLHIESALGNSSPPPMLYIKNTNGPAEIKLQGGGDSWTLDTDYDADNLIIRGSGTEVIRFKQDGRGLSQFTAKGWAQWSGTSLHDSHNVSSVASPSAGKFTINWDVDLANANYAAVAMGQADRWLSHENQPTTSDIDVLSYARSGALESGNYQDIIVFGD